MLLQSPCDSAIYVLTVTRDSATQAAAVSRNAGLSTRPTSIYLSVKLAPHLLGPIAVSAYSYMALVPLIQPPIMRALTTKKERAIRMDDSGEVPRWLRIFFPIEGVIGTAVAAGALLAMLK